MTKIRHITFRHGQYAGILVKGTERVGTPTSGRHMDHAWWLTTQLESSKWGTVQSYDGAGISGGPIHNTAILPASMTQGSLWKLLRRLEVAAPCQPLDELWQALRGANYFVSRRGELCYYDRGGCVTAEEIRNLVAPPNGVVPRTGPEWEQARSWALRFHKLLAHPATWSAQCEYAIEYLVTGREKEESNAYGPNIDHVSAMVGEGQYDVRPEVDLAMSVYHSHSVNGPTPAIKALRAVAGTVRSENNPVLFSKVLLWQLGKTRYGRWQDDKVGRNRYDHSRIKAMRSGLWPDEFFEGRGALMPENLPPARPR